MLRRLSDMKPGDKGTIQEIEDPKQVSKLLEMGCVPGEPISVEHIAPLGDPIAVSVSGYKLSLRKIDARHILVENRD